MFFNLLDGIITTPLIISSVCLAILIILLAFICDTNKKKLDTNCIAFAGVSVALSFGLSFIRIFQLPLGGSVTLASILPLLVFSYVYGTKKGVFVGIILGVLTLIVDLEFAIHPAQIILDYIIAYGAMGLVDMFSKIEKINKYPIVSFVAGSIIACIIRFACHTLAGVFAWETPIWASIAYNSFVFVDLGIAIVVGVILFSSKPILKMILARKNNKKY